jgi:hypothetical protein
LEVIENRGEARSAMEIRDKVGQDLIKKKSCLHVSSLGEGISNIKTMFLGLEATLGG